MFTRGTNVKVKRSHPKWNRLFEDMTLQGVVEDISEGKFGGLVLVELERTKELRWFKPEHLEEIK